MRLDPGPTLKLMTAVVHGQLGFDFNSVAFSLRPLNRKHRGRFYGAWTWQCNLVINSVDDTAPRHAG